MDGHAATAYTALA